MMWDCAYVCETGLRARQEDRVLLGGAVHAQGQGEANLAGDIILAVMDGVGGEQHGDLAAQLAGEALIGLAAKAPDEEMARGWVELAHQAVLGGQASSPMHRRMATTVAGLALGAERWLAFNTGDSRVYAFRDGVLRQLSQDHSLAYELRLSANARQEEIPANIITRSLGSAQWAPSVFAFPEPAQADIQFVLCTDGVWGSLSQEEFEELLGRDTSKLARCRAIVEKALANGAADNLSIIIGGLL